jgi:uroporphyrinogen decarboxylase
MKPVSKKVLLSHRRLAIPILSFPGGRLVGATVKEMLYDPNKQVAAQLALRDLFHLPALLSAMDLSVEAEAFGSPVRFSDREVPTITERIVNDRLSIEALKVPPAGTKRTRVSLASVEALTKHSHESLVLGCLIGPFSLAGRMYGTSEALLATVEDPDTIKILVEKATEFLVDYARAFKEAGANGLLIAEPTAGLISPNAVVSFSSSYVGRIVDAVDDESFQVVLHNCGARGGHVRAMLESGATALHVGKMVDIATTLSQVPTETLLCGNLDPVEVFLQSTPAQVTLRTIALLEATRGYQNYVISSGCDIPAGTELNNIKAFFDSVEEFNRGSAGSRADSGGG